MTTLHDNSAIRRVASLIADRIDALRLDLRNLHVLAEAATGPYAATPAIAAAAGAKVTAFGKSTHYGTFDEASREVLDLAAELGVSDRIQTVDALDPATVARADVITNSGHLRPLNAAFIAQMKPGAAISLMYECWELRPGEVDLAACRKRGVRVAGTNECHPDIRVFDYLGMLAIYGLFQCRVPVCFSRILLICDNPFAPHIAKALVDAGASLEILGDPQLPDAMQSLRRSDAEAKDYDAVVVAATPTEKPIIGQAGAARYLVDQLGAFPVLVQVWGDVDRASLPNVACFPAREPRRGHMGILLSDLGPDSIVRLQAGGLKVGEVLVSQPAADDPAWNYCQSVESTP